MLGNIIPISVARIILFLSLSNSYKFKAREFNPRIVSEQGNLGVKPLPRKAVTEPEPFVFESDQRLQQMKKEQSHEEVSWTEIMQGYRSSKFGGT